MGIPDWKAQRIERKNRQAAAIYAVSFHLLGMVLIIKCMYANTSSDKQCTAYY
ncbi:hypothetical protein AHF37_07792 [Paragonimus kellicotti]|nr:hypothetical protein AHF37_07792 [Paragonimus kellicotti]